MAADDFSQVVNHPPVSLIVNTMWRLHSAAGSDGERQGVTNYAQLQCDFAAILITRCKLHAPSGDAKHVIRLPRVESKFTEVAMTGDAAMACNGLLFGDAPQRRAK